MTLTSSMPSVKLVPYSSFNPLHSCTRTTDSISSIMIADPTFSRPPASYIKTKLPNQAIHLSRVHAQHNSSSCIWEMLRPFQCTFATAVWYFSPRERIQFSYPYNRTGNTDVTITDLVERGLRSLGKLQYSPKHLMLSSHSPQYIKWPSDHTSTNSPTATSITGPLTFLLPSRFQNWASFLDGYVTPPKSTSSFLRAFVFRHFHLYEGNKNLLW